MSKAGGVFKSYKVLEVEKRPLASKFVQTLKAGLAVTGPPLGPLLGKYGINVAAFCRDFNQKTSHYIKGIPIPCIISVNPDRSYNIALKKPNVKYYLLQAAGITSTDRFQGISGKTTIKHIYEIAKILHEDPHSYYQIDDLKEVCKYVIHKAYVMGIEIVRELDPVEYGEYLKAREEYMKKLSAEFAAEQEAKLLRK